jgi:hypothetical protein
MDPFTIAAIAGGVQALGGAAQSIFSGRKKAENELNAFAKQSPLYKGSKSINDYYQQAMNRYNENPYQSQQYQLGAMNAQRATAQGIGALQDRRSAIGGISRLAAGQQNAMQNLGAQAEAQRSSRFGQLGQAAQAKTAEDYKMFDINQMTPYNRQLQLKQMAAQAANERHNAGLQMVGSALGGIAQAGMMAGFNKGPKNPLTTTTTPASSEFDSFLQNQPKLSSGLIPKTPAFSYTPKLSNAIDPMSLKMKAFEPYQRTNSLYSNLAMGGNPLYKTLNYR